MRALRVSVGSTLRKAISGGTSTCASCTGSRCPAGAVAGDVPGRSALEYPQRPQPRDLPADPGAVHDVDDIGDILVGLGDLLGDRRERAGADLDAARGEVALERGAPRLALGLAAAHEPARAVAGRSERLAIRALRTDQHVGVAPHVS